MTPTDQKPTLGYAIPGAMTRRARRWRLLVIALLAICIPAWFLAVTFADGSKAMNAFLAFGEIGFFVALIGLPSADRFSPGVRKWLRRTAWVLFIAGIVALVIQEKYHTSTTFTLPL